MIKVINLVKSHFKKKTTTLYFPGDTNQAELFIQRIFCGKTA